MRIPAIKTMFIVTIASSFMVMGGCTSSEEKAYNSQTDLNKRKIKIAEDYEKCVQKSTSEEEMTKCEALLKAAQALQ